MKSIDIHYLKHSISKKLPVLILGRDSMNEKSRSKQILSAP